MELGSLWTVQPVLRGALQPQSHLGYLGRECRPRLANKKWSG